MPYANLKPCRIYYEETGHGPAVVLIPGLGADHRTWAVLLPILADHFRCVTLDHRDSGQSDPASAPYAIQELAADIVGLQDALNIKRCHLVGTSMGGAVAQEVAIAHPGRVDRLVLIATYTSSDARGAAILESWLHLQRTLPREAYLRAIYPWLYSVEDYAAPGLIEGVLQYALENPHVQKPDQYERQVRAALSHHTVGRLGHIRAPTLLLCGEEDILTPPRFAHSLLAEIPDVRLQPFPGTGHALVWTRTAEVAHAINEFLPTNRV